MTILGLQPDILREDLGTDSSSFSAYNFLLMAAGVVMATVALARYAESQNRFDYKGRLTRIAAGLFMVTMRLFHTNNEDLDIPTKGPKLIGIGSHKTALEGFVVASKLRNPPAEKASPPRFFATDGFNVVPGVKALLDAFQTIPIKAEKKKTADGRSANQDALDIASDELSKNGTVLIFPQGNFAYKDKKPPRIYDGIAKLAIKSNVPIHVVRVDGFWCLLNPLVPSWLKNNSYYRSILSFLHMNNIRATKCREIDFHLLPENKNLSEKEKIFEISAQLYAYFRPTGELSPEQIGNVKGQIDQKIHHRFWRNREAIDIVEKKLRVAAGDEIASLGDELHRLEVESELLDRIYKL